MLYHICSRPKSQTKSLSFMIVYFFRRPGRRIWWNMTQAIDQGESLTNNLRLNAKRNIAGW